MIYRLFFRLFLQRIDAELAHGLALGVLRMATVTPGVRTVLRRLMAPRDRHLEVRALGLTFPSPLGVGAGVDKSARAVEGLATLGFGCVEVGTVTAIPQDGNPRPRVFRLARDGAILNRMGFPNPGAEVVADRLRQRTKQTIVGVNVGKSRLARAEGAGDDYRASVRLLAPVSDYMVINVSSPNTPALRELQAVEPLRRLLADVRGELEATDTERPILIKISPDLSDHEIDAIGELAVTLELDGIVAVNTTVNRSGLKACGARAASIEGGGISGAPLKARALEVLQRLYAQVGAELFLISVGGIETPDDVWDRILAGASLVQVHTGFIYAGPAWPRQVNRALARRVREAGRSSIQELVGAGAASGPRVSHLSNGRDGGAPSLVGTSGSPEGSGHSRVV